MLFRPIIASLLVLSKIANTGDCFTIGENRLWWDEVGCHLGIMLRHCHQMGKDAQKSAISEMLRGNLESLSDLKQSQLWVCALSLLLSLLQAQGRWGPYLLL